MTEEEINTFKEKIAETIMPIANNMTEDQIHELIEVVEKENPNLPNGFGNMLFEQIKILKYNQVEKEKKELENSLFKKKEF